MNKLFLLFIVLPNLLIAQKADRDYPIIDVHLHAYELSELSKLLPSPRTGNPSPATPEEHIKQCLNILKRENVVLGIVSGPIKSVGQWTKAEPKHIWGAFTVGEPGKHLNGTPFNYDILRELIIKKEIRVIGEIGNQYRGYAINDPGYDELFKLAIEFDIPVAIHTGFGPPGITYVLNPNFRLRYGNPLLLEDILIKYPKLRVYIMHVGIPWMQETLAMFHMFPQLYADIGALCWVADLEMAELKRALLTLKELSFLDRVMFGSDQMNWPEGIELAIDFIENADFLTENEKKDIFFNNAVRFLNLSDEEVKKLTQID